MRDQENTGIMQPIIITDDVLKHVSRPPIAELELPDGGLFRIFQQANNPTKISYSRKQQGFRMLFMGTMVSLVIFLGKILNPFWGRIFTTFLVATFLALMTVHFTMLLQSCLRLSRKYHWVR
jgi:hypothetical protein